MKSSKDFWHVLDENKRPTPVSIFEADEAMMDNRHVMNHTIDGVHISTVFLPFDHGYGVRALWFETMIFGGKYDEFQYRYETWEEAQRGHIAFSLPVINERRTEKKIFKLVDRILWLLMVTITLIGCVIWIMI